MPSTARQSLEYRLADFDELIIARDRICRKGAGRPAKRRGAAVIRSATVLLSAAFEAYVEEVYDDAVDRVFALASVADRNALKKDTSEKLNNASVFKVNRLFFNLGIPWIMQNPSFHWQKFSNQRVRETLDELVRTRNKIAHGENITVRKPTVLKWRDFVTRLADRIDVVVADFVEDRTGHRPW